MSRFAAPPTDDEADRSRARARTPEELAVEWDGAPPKRARVRFIIDMMTDGRWETGKSGPVLATAWGLHPDTLKVDAAEASRHLEDPANLEQARVTVATRSLEWADEAAGKGKYDSAGRLLEVHAKVAGAIATTPTVNVLVDQRGQMRPELSGVLVAACETAAAMGLDPRAFRDALAGRLAASLPTAAVMALPAPACASPADRARELVAALCEVMPEVEDASEVRPALLAMVADDE